MNECELTLLYTHAHTCTHDVSPFRLLQLNITIITTTCTPVFPDIYREQPFSRLRVTRFENIATYGLHLDEVTCGSPLQLPSR